MKPERLESPYMVAKLLNALKDFYTFKELEEKLCIHSQVLWRYTSMMSRPERKTAREILKRIENAKLVDRVISKTVMVNIYGYVETWKYKYNIKFWDLVGYKTTKLVGDAKVDVIISFPESDAASAMIISTWLGGRAYAVREDPVLDSTRYLGSTYISNDRGKVVAAYIPAGAIKRGEKVLLVKNVVKNWQSLTAIKGLVEKAGAELWGAVAVVSISNKWRESAEKIKLKNVNILKELQYS